MKTKMLIFLLCISQFIKAQNYQVNKSTLSTSISIPDALQNSKGTDTISTPIILNKKEYFEEIAEIGDNVFLKDADGLIITMTKTQCDENMDLVKGKWGFGILTLPIKVRIEGGSEDDNTKRYFDFEGGYNLGLAVTRRVFGQNIAEIKGHIVFCLNTSQVEVTPKTTNNIATSEQNNIAISPTLGFIFQFKNDLQIVAVTGIDYLSGEIGSNWIYRNKPYFGIGIGFAALNFGEKDQKLTSKKNQ